MLRLLKPNPPRKLIRLQISPMFFFEGWLNAGTIVGMDTTAQSQLGSIKSRLKVVKINREAKRSPMRFAHAVV